MVTSTSPKILQDPHCLGVRRFGFKPWVPESKERAVEILAWQGIVISFCTYTHTHTNIQITRGVSVALSVAQERHPLNTSKHSRYSTLWRSKNRVEVLQLKWFEKIINWNAHYITDWSAERATNSEVDGGLLINIIVVCYLRFIHMLFNVYNIYIYIM